MPPADQPATLSTIILLVNETELPYLQPLLLQDVSLPFTCISAMPPPWPPWAKFPWTRLESTVSDGPEPSVTPPAGGASPSMAIPPPLVEDCWKNDWLKMIVLFAIVPPLLQPMWPIPPPSLEL